MTNNSLFPTKSSLMKQFFVVYSVLITLMMMIMFGWYWFSVEQEFNSTKQKEHLLLHVHEKAIMDEYQSVLSDLINLASLPIHFGIDKGSFNSLNHVKPELEKTYLSYAKTRGRYDQIRFLGTDGQEIVRVNDYDGHPQVVPRAALQNKSDRYYVKTLSKLSPNQIYISRLDLNIEHGVIEQPLKPMIRIGIGLYDHQGREQGIVVMNYLGDWLFQSMNFSHKAYGQLSTLFLVNQDGYWLHGAGKDKEFGFMYPDKKQVSFAYEYPVLWQKMKQQREGQILTHAGLYSFKTFSVLKPKFSSLKGRYHFSDKQFVSDDNRQDEWVLISFVPENLFSNLTDAQFKTGLPYVAIVMTFMAFIAFILAGYRVDQGFLRNRIKYMAYHDELTGLLNRHSLTSEEGKIFFKQTEDQRPFAVFFLDLDGFKPINDQYGHHIGDEVLKIVSKRITGSVRLGDIVIRIGGDEFAVIACDAMSKKGSLHFAQKIIDKIAEPMHIENRQLSLGTSIGIALYPENGLEINQLIDAADLAMYQAKNSGKGQCCFAT